MYAHAHFDDFELGTMSQWVGKGKIINVELSGQVSKHKHSTCYNVRKFVFTWPWIWKRVYGLTIFLFLFKVGFTRSGILDETSFTNPRHPMTFTWEKDGFVIVILMNAYWASGSSWGERYERPTVFGLDKPWTTWHLAIPIGRYKTYL